MASGASEYLLELNHISKSFPGVKALDDVNLKLRPGSVHALCGENGAGKSTLIKIINGIYKLDEGEIIYRGEKIIPQSPKSMLEMGIATIHQELSPVLDMTVAENIFLGREQVDKLGNVDYKKMWSDADQLLKDFGLKYSPKALLGGMTVSDIALIEIVKAISWNASVVIMDEPTSSITESEVHILFENVKKLQSKGVGIIYISHKMDEIYKIADTLTIMRDGEHVVTKKVSEISEDEVIRLMVGRELSNMYTKSSAKLEEYDENEIMMEVSHLTKEGLFQDISFTLKRGEILGVSGLMGAGRTEVMETVFGLRKPDSGEIWIKGKKVSIKNPATAIRNELAFVSEDRKLYGLNLAGSIKKNVSLAYLRLILIARWFVDFGKERRIVDDLIAQLRIKTTSRDTIVNNLSGGNQQKVILAKWLMGDPDIFIMDEPTRGIDVGAKAEIYKIMDTLAKRGKSIIMISSEMPELLGMSDHIIVMHEGKITGSFSKEECNQEKLMICSMGGNANGN